MSSQVPPKGRRTKSLKITAILALGALALSGCTEQAQIGWLPTERGTTSNTDRIIDLWVNSWIAALAVGILTWGLIIWCIVAYRRRKNDTGFPKQVSYNLPLEVFYLTVPLLMILVLFFFTDQDQRAIDARVDNPDVIVDARAKQWSWDFNYVKQDRYSAGQQTTLDGQPGKLEDMPVLYLPVNKSVEIQLNSRDVIHSFWVPAFLQKRDMFPFKTNYITLTPQREGVFEGKCAELCGQYHSEMLFRVAVVSQEEFDQKMTTLRQGQIGQEYDRNPNAELKDAAKEESGEEGK
ncbi:cytochrome c oxidase subunit II [Haematomicrobium sanguinis]|uniref:aa3-type cytochrome oxidase subunit II n=1 Tax=Haematomicrobium sanguinis TaxID=479106 RepID=UPI00068DAFFF